MRKINNENNPKKFCYSCYTELTTVNAVPSTWRDKTYLCRDCDRVEQRICRKNHPETVKKNNRIYRERNLKVYRAYDRNKHNCMYHNLPPPHMRTESWSNQSKVRTSRDYRGRFLSYKVLEEEKNESL